MARSFVIGFLYGVILCYGFSVIMHGASYGGITEQVWLDRCVGHIRMLRSYCTDPDLQEVLDYAVKRYNQIGPFDVAVVRLWQSPFRGDSIAIACNNPVIPGMSVDIDVLKCSIHDGAMVVVHEALHDFYPYLGHAHITPREEKLEQLYESIRRLR